ncbi:MAG TPA: porin [Terriglobales bacterium]|nr:porin [Terriglobales bacterium]
MRRLHFTAAVILLVAAQALAQSSQIQPSSTSSTVPNANATAAAISEMQARLDAMEKKLQELENRVNAALPGPSASAAAPATTDMNARMDALEAKLDSHLVEHNAQVQEGPTLTVGRDTFSISSPDKTYSLRIGGHFQLDGKFFPGNDGDLLTNSFNLRRARPIIEASLGQYVDFRFVPDFGNGQTLIYDAYADVKISPYFVVRGGKFKTPMGLELLQNDPDLTFLERSLASDLVQNRDAGVEFYGDVKQRLSYQFAVDNGSPIGANLAVPSQGGKNVVERIFATPFAPSGIAALKGLGFGIGSSQGRQNPGATLPTLLSTGGQAVFFSYTGTAAVPSTFTDGTMINISPQAYYYAGPLGLMAEYVTSTQDIGGKTANKNTIVRAIENHAWQVTGSWMLTGEQNSYRSIVPRKALEGGGHESGWGAWEVAARYSELRIDPLAFSSGLADITKSARASHEWVVGLNWYLNFFVKLQFNYDQSTFDGGAVKGNRPTEHAIMERLQVAF